MAILPSGADGSVPLSVLSDEYALDTVKYCHAFFPQTVRQNTPVFHRELLETVERPQNRQVAIEVFRGGAKTSLLRLITSKRIAYGTSRTIMFVSASQAHALRSVRWIRRRVEDNLKWANFFGLEPGDKWTDEVLEIRHKTLGIIITVIAVGITGQTRGINVDDYRPDLIIVDDPDDEESTATPEQRDKHRERFFGAILNSLTPPSENPEAKIVLLATSLNKEDLVNTCHTDPTWITIKYSILDEDGKSRWESRYPTEQVRDDKAAFIARGQILLWLREFECTVGDEETADLKREWLKFWDMLPERLIVVVTCDPAPPPSERQIQRALKDKDEEVWSAVGLAGGKYYLLEQVASRDHDAEWSAATFFGICSRWRPIKVGVETAAYQRTLKNYLEMKMREVKTYYNVVAYPEPHKKDRRKKHHRILQAFQGPASQGQFFVHPSQQEFISQFAAYPNVKHDDRLDSAAIGMEMLGDLEGLDDDEIFAVDGAGEVPAISHRPAP